MGSRLNITSETVEKALRAHFDHFCTQLNQILTSIDKSPNLGFRGFSTVTPYISTRPLKSLKQNKGQIKDRAHSKYKYVIHSSGEPICRFCKTLILKNVASRGDIFPCMLKNGSSQFCVGGGFYGLSQRHFD